MIRALLIHLKHSRLKAEPQKSRDVGGTSLFFLLLLDSAENMFSNVGKHNDELCDRRDSLGQVMVLASAVEVFSVTLIGPQK